MPDSVLPNFTPGPWFAQVSGIEIGGVGFVGTAAQIADDDADPVASNVIIAADAHLIAAAPDLFAAVEALLAPKINSLMSVADGRAYRIAEIAAVAALAKARGEHA